MVYDILIFDIDMPGTNGIEAARRIRQIDKSAVLLFVTNIAQYAKRIGFSKYTDKLDVTAFQNPDGRLIVVILNRTEEDLPVILRLQNEIATVCVRAHSISIGTVC